MTFEKPEPQTRVETDDQLTPEQEDQAAYWLAQIEKEGEAARQAKRVLEPSEVENAVSDLERLCALWLEPGRLASLREIKSEDEAVASSLRAEAKMALAEILQKTSALKDVIHESEYNALMEKYSMISQAVGMINLGQVDHTREVR